MQKKAAQEAAQGGKHRKTGKRLLRALACVVVFCTVYALILPALTLERSPECGMEEHRHTEACYTQVDTVTGKAPVCTSERLGIHTHTQGCPIENGQYACGQSDYIIHTHDEMCYDEDGTLWCPLPEMGEHTHTDACYTGTQAGAAHEHTYSTVRGELICTAAAEAHTHTEACYAERETLLCTKAESEGHVHGESCFDESGVLICTMEESEGHTHGADCYGMSRELTCTLSGQAHEHTDACYAAERVLSCTLPTGAQESGTRVLSCGFQQGLAHQHGADCFQPVEKPADTEKLTCTKAESDGHKHGKRCYGTWALSCGKEEHEHKESCWQDSDPGADLESEAVWAGSVAAAERNGDWRHDVIAVARTQIGYTESSRNFVTDESGTRKGYTRYGAWYGDAYGDWCAMFVSFCMHYAEIPTEAFPAESSCQRWVEALKSEAYGLYREAAEYTPEMGDAVFFDWDGDGIANHVGLVAELVCDRQGTAAEIRTIEGNNGMQVASFRYAIGDRRILGYGEMPEKPDTPMLHMSMASTPSGRSTTRELGVTGISGTNAKYDPNTNLYDVDLNITFTIPEAEIEVDSDYVFNYPQEVTVPPGLLDVKKDLYDNDNVKVGAYTFVKNADNTYSVHVDIDDSYIIEAGKEISGNIQFGGTLDKQPDGNGDIIVDCGSAGLQLKIDGKDITYPGGETNQYDISTSKSGEFKSDGDKLIYTVYVRSRKGTPDPIAFTDVIDSKGIDLGTPTVQIEQGTFRYNNQWDMPNNSTSFVTRNDIPYTWENNTLSMNLPQLDEGLVDAYNCYRITYTYDLAGKGVTEVTPSNRVKVQAKDDTTKQTVTDEKVATVQINKTHTMSKSGWYNAEEKRIKWTITLNSNHVDLVGTVLTDEMLGKISGITIDPNRGYKTQTDPVTGNVTAIEFIKVVGRPETTNTNSYTITYYTPVDPEWNNQKIENNAVFDPTPGEENKGDEIPVGTEVTVSGNGEVTKRFDAMTPSADGKTGEIDWTVTLKVPATGLPEGIVISDALSSGSTGAQHWMTRGQIAGWTPRLTWAGGGTVDPAEDNISFYTADGAKYSYAQIKADTGGTLDGLKFTKFEISFPDGLTVDKADELSFSCRTTADLENAEPGETKYYNRVDVGDKNATAQYAHFKDGVVKTDGSDRTGTSQTSSEGALSWKVKVSTAEACGKLTVKDTLPNGVILDGVSLSGATNMALNIDEYGFITGENDTCRIEGTYRGNEVTLTMTGKGGQTLPEKKQYVFTFDCHADETALEGYGPGKSYTFKNTVTVKADEAEIGSSEQTQEWTNNTPVEEKKVINKGGAWDNDNRRLNYAIEINPDGEDLVEATDVLTLKDTLQYYNKRYFYYPVKYEASMKVTLIPDSVELYKASKGADGKLVENELITNWSWVRGRADNGDTTEITITAEGIPDKTPLIFKYSYEVESTIREGTEEDLAISNSAKLEGTTYTDTDTKGSEKWKDQTSSGTITTGKTYTFYKAEKDNFGKRLEQAEFSVYRYDPAAGGKGAYVVSYLTDRNGKFQIEWVDDGNNPYEYGTVYMVTETKAPAGYILPEEPEVFTFYFSDPTGAVPPPADIPAGAVDLTENSETVYVENEKNAVDITVNKLWFNMDGGQTTHSGGSITLELYRRESDRPDAGGDTRLVGEIQLGNNGSASLNSSYQDGTTLTFSITCRNYSGGSGPTLSFNGTALTPDKEEAFTTPAGGWNRPDRRFTYSIVLRGGENTLSGSANHYDSSFSGFTVTPPTDPGTPQTPIATQTISMADGWQCTFTDLPKLKDENGTKTYYFYYVKEVVVPNYTTSYENNGGIAGGTITVKNTLERELTVEMPQTGGGGTHAVYAAGAVLTLGAGGLLVYNGKRRRREDAASS